MTIGLEHLRRRTGSVVHNAGALILAALTLCAIVFGLGFAQNPLFWPIPVGGPFVNLILLGYGLPAILTAALALHARGVRPPQYSAGAAVVAVALALAYLTLEVRTLFHGDVLTRGPTTDAEGYTYSAVWLAFGVVLLAAGMFLHSQAVRLASAAVVILTVCKVFLIDMQRAYRYLPGPVVHRARHRAVGDRLSLPAPALSPPPKDRSAGLNDPETPARPSEPPPIKPRAALSTGGRGGPKA